MKHKIPLNIPNLLSLYRLFSFPVILVIAILGYESFFAILLIISLITDFLDGFIARTFNMKTEIGAKLDSIADNGMFILFFLGVFLFKWDDIGQHAISFFIFMVLFVSCILLSLIKFGRFPSLHLYSWKIGGYIIGSFFLVLFAFDFYVYLYYIMIAWSVLSFIEHIIIQLLIKNMISNAKGLYWVLKNLKEINNKNEN